MVLRTLQLLALASCGLMAMERANSDPAMAASSSALAAQTWEPQDSGVENLEPAEILEDAFERCTHGLWSGSGSRFFPYTNKGSEPLIFTLAEDFRENTFSQVLVFSFQKVGWLSLRGDRSFILQPGEPVILAVKVMEGLPVWSKVFKVDKGNWPSKFMRIAFETQVGEGPTRTWLPSPTAKQVASVRLGRSARADCASPNVPPAELRGRTGWPEVRRQEAEPLPCADPDPDAPS